jgi:hypothetical protein
MALRETVALPLAHPAGEASLRRCWYRRLTRVAWDRQVVYDVECLFPARRVSVPLGDLATAAAVCDTCQASGIFRPDEE